MREPPPDLSDAEVLALVRRHWSRDVDRVEHLPIGFGAHHWRALDRSRPLLFVTYDTLARGTARHTADSLEAAYAGTAELAFALDFVVAGLPSHGLTYTVPTADGALSATPWINGATGEPPDDAEVARMLARLHAAHPPRSLPRWAPLSPPDLADRLAEELRPTWSGGPMAAQAQAALRAHLLDVRRWVAEHRRLTTAAASRPWVVTHGEPHAGNLVVTAVRTLLVDWESARLAPRERDLRSHPAGTGPDPEMVRLFDLEWRLDEIAQYAAWFAAPHTGTADDRIALGGLLEELDPSHR